MAGKKRSRLGWGIGLFIWWMICLAIAAVIAVPVIYQLSYADRIYEGVIVDGIPLGGLTLDEAVKTLRTRLTPYSGAPVTLRYGTRSWTLSPGNLGVSIDARAAAAEAYSLGRRSPATGAFLDRLRPNLLDQWQAWRFTYPISPTLLLDENRLAITLKQITREVDQPPREGMLNFTDVNVVGTAGAAGRVVNVDAMRTAVLDLLRRGKGGIVPLVIEEREPAVTSVDAAVAKANTLLSHPLNLAAEGTEGIQSSVIDRTTLRSWLKFSPAPGEDGAIGLAVQVDDAKTRAHVQAMAKQFDRPAQEAALDYDAVAKQVVVVKPSQVGQSLDIKGATEAISRTLLGLATSPGGASDAAPGEPVVITLPVKLIQPKVDSTRIASLGIKELVTQGTTYFAGSSAERVHNIVNGAQKFRGVVIPPGEEFSFNKYVGDVTAADGFVEGLIIGAERTAVGIGGGVCQVSTTAFRAALQGGFPITERHAHGYVVSWYGEPGMDATIYTPNVDFRFKNDTGAFLLIKPEVDTAKGRITFSFYGTRPNRTVELSKPEISNVQSPEPPIYQEDSSLPRGTMKQVDWAKDGQDVVVKRTIRTADGKVTEDKFTSKYQPWRSIFLYGPDTKLPEGAVIIPPVTPTPTPKSKP